MKKRLLTITGVSILALAVAMVFGMIAPGQAYAKYTSKPKATIKLSVEKPHYYVRFHANAEGVQGEMADQIFTYGTAQTLTPNMYEHNGFVFIGWNTKANGLGRDFSDGAEVIDLIDEPDGVYNLYAQWEKEEMHTEFEMSGTCVFHGHDIVRGDDGSLTGGFITGNDCIVGGVDWADGTHRYIDTGVKLYSEANYDKDFEIGFTIESYDPNGQYIISSDPDESTGQNAFMNSKLEDEGRHWPGLVIRRSGDKIEVTQTIKKGANNYEKKNITRAASSTTKVVVARVDGIIYYSFNGSAFTVLQDMNGTSDYFDTNVWFGAAAKADGTPMRYLDATLTGLYIKVGEAGSNKHTVSFDAGGIADDPSDITVISSGKIGDRLPSMPSSIQTEDGLMYFNGWYTGENGSGVEATEDLVIDEDMILYAYWRDSVDICSVNDTNYSSLQDCINAAGVEETITLLGNAKAQLISIDSGKDITLDLNGFTISDNKVVGKAIIESNKGKLTVINGTITSSMSAGVINNITGGELHIGANARIIATGDRQAIYNNGGKLVISDNAYLSAVTSQRAAVHNLNDGIVEVIGGTIVSMKQDAIKNESGTLTIGTSGLPISREAPIIQGATYGVNTSVDITMYDGELRGKTAAINNANRITLIETGALSVGIDSEETATIDGVVYKILYYR